MKLNSFQIQNYRSIDDSGVVSVKNNTVLIGENDCGKTNLLKALAYLNPVEQGVTLNKSSDFPNFKEKNNSEFMKPVVSTVWTLTKPEQDLLTENWEGTTGITQVKIEKNYENMQPIVQVLNLNDIGVSGSEIKKLLSDLIISFSGRQIRRRRGEINILNELEEFKDQIENSAISDNALNSVILDLTKFQKLHVDRRILQIEVKNLLSRFIDRLNSALSVRRESLPKISHFILNQFLPKFLYLNEFPILETDQSLNKLLASLKEKNTSQSIQQYEKFCNYTDINLQELNQISQGDRYLYFRSANKNITKLAKKIWNDKNLKLEMKIDGDNLNVYVITNDKDELFTKFDQQGFGFRTYFSMAMNFESDYTVGVFENVILLLDEPGLHLHAEKQKELINYFSKGIKNQIIYTTHSPFMIPMEELNHIRPVIKSKKGATTVLDDIIGKQESLYTLQSALGYEFSQNLFFGQRNLVVEGITDFIAITAMSVYLNIYEKNLGLKDNIVVIPANGVPKNKHLAIWLSYLERKVILLQDYDKDTDKHFKNVTNSSSVETEQLISVADILKSGKERNVDIEDLLGLELYKNLVETCYKTELKDKNLVIEEGNLQLYKRVEIFFEMNNLEFDKRLPINLLSRTVITNPKKIMTEEAKENFCKLFEIVNSKFELIDKRFSASSTKANSENWSENSVG